MKRLLLITACGMLLTGTAALAAESDMQDSQAAVAPEDTPSEIIDFDTLDTNDDDYVTREEAGEMPMLEEQWSDYDSDADDRMSEDEFSAFEEEAGLNEVGERVGGEQGSDAADMKDPEE